MGEVTDVEQARAIGRWKEGHQALHVYLVAINTVLADAMAAIAGGDLESLTTCLRRLVVLYDASTATMEYAADFPRGLYETAVRPSMAPPFVTNGFSGVLNTEHRVMVRRLKALGRSLSAAYGRSPGGWPAGAGEIWADVQRARRDNLERHELICGRFVTDGVSLLRAHLAERSSHGTETSKGE